MPKRLTTALVLLSILILISCDDGNNLVNVPDLSSRLYVVNGLSENISAIDLDNNMTYNNTDSTGMWPSEMEYVNGWLYLLNSGSNTLQTINIQSHNASTAWLGDFKSPSFFEFIPGGKVAITNWQAGTVSILSLASGLVDEEIPVGNGAWDILYLEGKLYVGVSNIDPLTYAYGQGQVVIIDAVSLEIDTTIDVGINPGPIFVDQQGEINIVCIGDYFTTFGEIYRLDPADNSILGIISTGGSPGYTAMNSVGIVYLAVHEWSGASYLMKYDSNIEYVIADAANGIEIQGESGYQGLAFDDEGNLYVCCFSTDHVVKVDGDGNILATYEVGDGPQSLVYAND